MTFLTGRFVVFNLWLSSVFGIDHWDMSCHDILKGFNKSDEF